MQAEMPDRTSGFEGVSVTELGQRLPGEFRDHPVRLRPQTAEVARLRTPMV